jgi:hypothetical protein
LIYSINYIKIILVVEYSLAQSTITEELEEQLTPIRAEHTFYFFAIKASRYTIAPMER